ncbi:MAG: hypothetical protein WCD11_23730 [Solirubrobacteraceae bacterium]
MGGFLLDDARPNQRSDGVGRRCGTNRFRLGDRLGRARLGLDSSQHRVGLGGVRRRNHLHRLVHRGDLGSNNQPSFGREETLSQQLPSSLPDRIEQRLRPTVLDEEKRQRRPGQQRMCQCHRVSRIKPGRTGPRGFHETSAAQRHDPRQQRAKVIIADDGPLDRAVVSLGDEEQIEQPQNSSAL